MNMPCSNTEALNEYEHRIAQAEIAAMRMKDEDREGYMESLSREDYLEGCDDWYKARNCKNYRGLLHRSRHWNNAAI